MKYKTRPPHPLLRDTWRASAIGLSVAAILAFPFGGIANAQTNEEAVVAFDKTAKKLTKKIRIAYLSECGQNAYCTARLNGIKAAAAKYGFEFKDFAANFSPAAQLKHVQNATVEKFDGYILAPTAAAAACSMWKRYLVPTGKPVVSIDLPMCGDATYTKGLAATVTMQRQAYFNAHINNAFASCKKSCKVAAVGGFLGSDLFNLWEAAIKSGAAKYPNVKVVVDQPGNYDPRTAFRVIQDGLRAHADISVVVSPWDDMTRGVERAIKAAGKKPGSDVRIYSIGGTKAGLKQVMSGAYNGTTLLLPYEESYYGAVALIMALSGKPINGYIDEAKLPAVTKGPGTIFITKMNAAKVTPNY